MRGRPVTSVLSAAAVLVMVAAPTLAAAKCVVRSPRDQAERVDHIFQGTVTGFRAKKGTPFARVTLIVERTWKGQAPSVVVLRVPTGKCAPELRTGERYTVFADRRGERYGLEGEPGSAVPGVIDPQRYGLDTPQSPQGTPFDTGDLDTDVGVPSSWTGLLVVLLIVVIVGIAALNAWLKVKRRKELAFLATQQGLAFSRYDPGTGIGLEPFRLFGKGDGRGWENFVVGTWQGIELVECDYWYYDESTDSKGRKSRTYHRFSAVVVPIDAGCPHLTIRPEGVFSRLADKMGFKDIEYELEEFNRAFQIECADRRFASAFVDQRMIQQLLRSGAGWSYEVVGDRALVYSDRLSPTALLRLLGTAKVFTEHVPRVIADLYPRVGQG